MQRAERIIRGKPQTSTMAETTMSISLLILASQAGMCSGNRTFRVMPCTALVLKWPLATS